MLQMTELRLKKVQSLGQRPLAGQPPSINVDFHLLVFWRLNQYSLDGILSVAQTCLTYDVVRE